MANIRLKHVNAFRDRHGKLRFYFRRGGRKAVPLPGLPGSAEFMDAYSIALAGDPVRFGPAKMIPGTVLATVTAYLARRLSPSLQRKPSELAAPSWRRSRKSMATSGLPPFSDHTSKAWSTPRERRQERRVSSSADCAWCSTLLSG
jgi:hypothetical protein